MVPPKSEESVAVRETEEEMVIRETEEAETVLREAEETEAAMREPEEEVALRKSEEELVVREPEKAEVVEPVMDEGSVKAVVTEAAARDVAHPDRSDEPAGANSDVPTEVTSPTHLPANGALRERTARQEDRSGQNKRKREYCSANTPHTTHLVAPLRSPCHRVRGVRPSLPTLTLGAGTPRDNPYALAPASEPARIRGRAREGWDETMRLNLTTALSAVLALCASRAAAQDERRWMEVFSDDTEVISIDTASLTPLGDGVYRVWERCISRTSSDVRVLARADFDCRLRLTRAVAVAVGAFAPVRASEDDREWTEILPGSRFEAELRQVCSTGGSAGGPR